MMLIYFKYETVHYCLLCEKDQIVWSHFKSVQDECDEFFWYVGTFANDLVRTGWQSSADFKARIIPSPAFHNKRQLYCGFPTIQTLEDVRRPSQEMC